MRPLACEARLARNPRMPSIGANQKLGAPFPTVASVSAPFAILRTMQIVDGRTPLDFCPGVASRVKKR
jgi:hypothetical protein